MWLRSWRGQDEEDNCCRRPGGEECEEEDKSLSGKCYASQCGGSGEWQKGDCRDRPGGADANWGDNWETTPEESRDKRPDARSSNASPPEWMVPPKYAAPKEAPPISSKAQTGHQTTPRRAEPKFADFGPNVSGSNVREEEPTTPEPLAPKRDTNRRPKPASTDPHRCHEVDNQAGGVVVSKKERIEFEKMISSLLEAERRRADSVFSPIGKKSGEGERGGGGRGSDGAGRGKGVGRGGVGGGARKLFERRKGQTKFALQFAGGGGFNLGPSMGGWRFDEIDDEKCPDMGEEGTRSVETQTDEKGIKGKKMNKLVDESVDIVVSATPGFVVDKLNGILPATRADAVVRDKKKRRSVSFFTTFLDRFYIEKGL